jgi:hypothetical protein
MGTCYVFGFAHEDIEAARREIESALTLRLEEGQEHDFPGIYYRIEIPCGTCVQIRRNSAPFIRWQGDPSNLWYPEFGLLVWVHGRDQESIAEKLRQVSGLSFLEQKQTM